MQERLLSLVCCIVCSVSSMQHAGHRLLLNISQAVNATQATHQSFCLCIMSMKTSTSVGHQAGQHGQLHTPVLASDINVSRLKGSICSFIGASLLNTRFQMRAIATTANTISVPADTLRSHPPVQQGRTCGTLKLGGQCMLTLSRPQHVVGAAVHVAAALLQTRPVGQPQPWRRAPMVVALCQHRTGADQFAASMRVSSS